LGRSATERSKQEFRKAPCRPRIHSERSARIVSPGGDLGGPGRLALSQHCGALRLHDHHAPQHADRFAGIINCDEAAGAEPAQARRYFPLMPDADKLTPADPSDFAAALAFALLPGPQARPQRRRDHGV
jgi:hypothetical protein